jgi:hypothetical protein
MAFLLIVFVCGYGIYCYYDCSAKFYINLIIVSAYYLSRKLTITTDIKRPKTDSRSYQAITLSNDLKVF